MKIKVFLLFIGFAVLELHAQNILDVLKINEIHPEEQIEGDIRVTDTVQSDDFYQLLFTSYYDTISLFEAKLNLVGNDSLILGIKGYESDMQCTFHPSQFYTIKDKNESLHAIENTFKVNRSRLIDTAKVDAILLKNILEINDVYLGEEGTVEQVFNEIYTPKYSFQKGSDTFEFTYTICDYIYLNHGVFTPEDWQTITDVKSITINFPH